MFHVNVELRVASEATGMPPPPLLKCYRNYIVINIIV